MKSARGRKPNHVDVMANARYRATMASKRLAKLVDARCATEMATLWCQRQAADAALAALAVPVALRAATAQAAQLAGFMDAIAAAANQTTMQVRTYASAAQDCAYTRGVWRLNPSARAARAMSWFQSLALRRAWAADAAARLSLTMPAPHGLAVGDYLYNGPPPHRGWRRIARFAWSPPAALLVVATPTPCTVDGITRRPSWRERLRQIAAGAYEMATW